MLQTRVPGTPVGWLSDGRWTQRVGNFTSVPTLIKQLGVDPATILQHAALEPHELESPEARVPYAALGRLLHKASHTTNCPHLGLLVGRMWRLSDLGIVGDVVANSRTVGEALQMLTRYQHLNSEGALAFVVDRGPMVDLGYAIYHPNVDGPDVMYDVLASIAISLMRDLCGPGWKPIEVLLPHAEPPDANHYRNLFRVPVRFNSEICALRFPVQWLHLEVRRADAERLRIAMEKADGAPPPDLLQQVCRAIRTLLLHERHSGDEVAAMLDMHRRTLNRRLHARGVTFQQVLDAVRFATARELLGSSDLSFDDVAATLGYAGVSAFMRTFNRWAGTTPGRWRRMTRASNDARPSKLALCSD